ncbi:metal-dependent hydrolase [Sporomusa malonica]|uniref:LexA-binding, inner membrane-associated putative hydrolase n=1 Tax=Sporomusa malonica TaxID=112901 RepID=A0A1W2DKV0_9FIRM|nr:metal-dependent hydrolase [Sporomusa malonica]SMC98150.1 LexA-binding, inner membrane-associated putative hydrolase [Sporomusa malonica]
MLPLGHMGITLSIVRTAAWLFRINSLDYRVLLVGSILPDLIDKPLRILFATEPIFGKGFGHSFLFLVSLYSVGKLLRNNQHKTTLWALWIGAVIHDVFDLMWFFPKIFFWPAFIPNLPKAPYEPWGQIIHFYGVPIRQVFALEVVGGGILLVSFIILALNNRLVRFLKTGKLSYTRRDGLSS